MKNAVLEKWKKGQKTMGTFTFMQSTTALECLGYTGLDYVIIDMEHSSVVTQQAEMYIMAAQSAELTPFVRINEISRSPVLKMLDAGAQGLIVPCVETVEQVKELISYGKYAPLGNRGFCPSRYSGFGFATHASKGISEYMDFCNRETMIIPQCETLGCLEHIEEIAALEGVDGIMIGPFDLSIALGKPAQFQDSEVIGAVKRILAACKEAGKMSLIFTGDTDAAKGYLAQGFDSVIVGLDGAVYIEAYKSLVEKVRY